MKRYNYYTDSKTDWLMQIPSEWKEQRIKTLFKLYDERNYRPLSEVNLISLYAKVGVVQHSDLKHTTGNRAVTADGYKIVKRGDIIVNILLCWMGAIGCSEYDGVTSPAYDVYSPIDGVNSKYYHYLFRLPQFSQQCYRAGKGIMSMRWRTYSPQFLNIVVPVPSPYEQAQIVRYLDWKASEVNQLILMLQKEIILLQEAKNIVLYKTITKGLYEEDYKDSGEPIIGEIPSTWDVCELKYVSKIYNGNSISDSEKDNYTVKTALPYIATKDVDLTSHTVDYENGLYVPTDSYFKIAPAGCTLVCIEGGSAGRKKAFISRNVAFVNKLCAFVPTNINDRFLFHFLCSSAFTDQFMRSVTGVIGGVSINEVKRILIPVPSREEQDIIAKKLDEKCEKFDNKILKLNAEIKLLKEYRERLIYDVVTGQIDVRDIEIPQYEYTEDVTNVDSEDSDEFDEAGNEEV